MAGDGVDPALVLAWLTGRSLARGLPPPVPDRGGFRVDTHSEAELKRWVFPSMSPGLVELAREIDAPRQFLKLCGTAEELRQALPEGWIVLPPATFMTVENGWPARPLPVGYDIETVFGGDFTHVRIRTTGGDVAASGYAAETGEAFVYDRIETDAAHRRRGLGGALMSALREAKRNRATQELLTATPDGRALYESLGWRALSPNVTASIDADGFRRPGAGA